MKKCFFAKFFLCLNENAYTHLIMYNIVRYESVFFNQISYRKLCVWIAHVRIQILKNVRHVGMMDSRLLTQHYTLLIIFELSERVGRRHNSTEMRWNRGGGRWSKKRKMGEWRQKRRPQITTINHQAVKIFKCCDGLLLAAAWYLCVCLHVCLLCFAYPELHSPPHCLRLSLNWQHWTTTVEKSTSSAGSWQVC